MNNVVYLLTCTQCKKQYIGETGRPFIERWKAGLGSNTFYQIQIQIHFLPEFQIQIQIQIHRQKSDQIQIQIQIQLIKYKYKYKYTMRPRQNCRHFTDDILNFIVLEEDCSYIQISLKIVSKGPIYNKPTLVQIMAWC